MGQRLINALQRHSGWSLGEGPVVLGQLQGLPGGLGSGWVRAVFSEKQELSSVPQSRFPFSL